MENIGSEEKLSVFKRKREYVADCFCSALKAALESKKKVSEAHLRDAWLGEIRKDKDLSEDGWYVPPPHGIILLFAKDSDCENNRLNFRSARPEEKWPKDDIFLDKKRGLIAAYASQVDKRTGIIADFGCVLYLGKDPAIKKHLQDCLAINKASFSRVKVGMRMKELHKIVEEEISKKRLENRVDSVTDKSKVMVMGHTIPVSYEPWSAQELKVFDLGNWGQIKDMISSKRKFINDIEELEIGPGFATTIEPRPTNPNNPDMPMTFFHTVCVVHEDSSKELVTNFKKIFKLAGMDYMLEML